MAAFAKIAASPASAPTASGGAVTFEEGTKPASAAGAEPTISLSALLERVKATVDQNSN